MATPRTLAHSSAKPHAVIIGAALHQLSTSARSPHAGAAAPTLATNEALLKIGNEGKATAKKLGEGGNNKAGLHLGHRMAMTKNGGRTPNLKCLTARSGIGVHRATADGGWTKLD
jgi:hypothetical protein